ncbi:MAG: preprotein translocase subunit Sec61beta [Candidatus Bathyarchaeota archaeon]|nr:preprotein translocase subunit Sec61beta [Candidatus Bathyarchaeota archaeon]
MSREKRRREEAPMPSAAAGLLRFYEEESVGIKIKPEIVVIAAIILILLVTLIPRLLGL